MMECRFLDRIEHANDRSILLVVLSDVHRELSITKSGEIDSFTFDLISSCIIDKMDSEIFRILTFSEFKILIGGIFALSPTPMNTLAQLIKSINSDMTSPQKFSKVIKLIELLLEEENFFFRMASSFSDQDIIAMDLCYSISSFSDRVSNFFSTISHSPYLPNELEIISRYENQLMKGILSVALNGHRFDKMGEINLCSYLISSYLPISFEFVRKFVDQLLELECASSICPKIILNRSVEERKQESLIISLIESSRNAAELLIMFGSDLTSDLSLKEAVVKKILLNPSFHSNGHVVQRSSLKLAEYFKKTDASSLKEIFVQLLEVFQDQSSIQHQLGVAVCIIDFANMLRLVDHGKSEKFSYKYTKYFRLSNEYLDLANCVLQFAVGMLPEFLKLVDRSRRQLGMFLAEYLTNLFECSAETLNFEYTEDNLIKELRSMALEQANPTPGESTETPKPSNSSKRKMYYDPRTQILDSDDDDIEIEAKQDQEFFQSVDERIHDNAERPVYIRDCISYLEDKEDCVKTMVALETLPQLIKKNATSIIDIEDELLERILFLENRFSLPGFMDRKREILSLLVANRPELCGELIEIFFAQRCYMSLRYLILDVIVETSNQLASSFMPSNSKTTNVPCSSTSSTSKIIRANKKVRESDRFINKFAIVASQFIYPLLNLDNDHGPHLDLANSDSPLLVRIITTLSHLISLSKNSSRIISIVGSLFLLLHRVRNSRHTSVIQACQICYLTIIETLPEGCLDVFATELQDCLHWVAGIVDSSSYDGDESLKATSYQLYNETQKSEYLLNELKI